MYPIDTLLQLQINPFGTLAIPFIVAFMVSLSMIPLLIKAAQKYQLLDLPNKRKAHKNPVPTFGGIAIMVGAGMAWLTHDFSQAGIPWFLLFAITTLFITGIMDDIKDLRASHKLLLELVLGFVIAYNGLRITSLQGFMGIHELPVILQYSVTMLAIAGITNAYNLIDGIDGLAGGISVISLLAAGSIFYYYNDPIFTLVSFSFAGAVTAFLIFNRHPAKIFMGDTGSLTIGFTLSVIVIRLMSMKSIHAAYEVTTPVIAISLVLIPVFDTIRVFTFRLFRGQAVFSPDKTHIHHFLTNAGVPHNIVTRLICLVHLIILLIVFGLNRFDPEVVLISILALVMCVTLAFKTIGDKRSGIAERRLKIKYYKSTKTPH